MKTDVHPKYTLVYVQDYSIPSSPFRIMEHAVIDGKLARREHRRFETFEGAIFELHGLNGYDNPEPIVLAYSSKTIDNTFRI